MTQPDLCIAIERWIALAEAESTAAGRDRAKKLRAKLAEIGAVIARSEMVWIGARPDAFEPIKPAQWEAMTGQKL